MVRALWLAMEARHRFGRLSTRGTPVRNMPKRASNQTDPVSAAHSSSLVFSSRQHDLSRATSFRYLPRGIVAIATSVSSYTDLLQPLHRPVADDHRIGLTFKWPATVTRMAPEPQTKGALAAALRLLTSRHPR
jgi:hypothetical protein